MRRRKDREPSHAEITLWGEVARSVQPLASRKLPLGKRPGSPVEDMISIEAEINLAAEHPSRKMGVSISGKTLANPSITDHVTSSKINSAVSKVPLSVKTPAVIGPLERKLRTALKRGTRPIEAVIDLHGMHQSEAYAALGGFLHRSSERGAGLVLVVTGKGANKAPNMPAGMAASKARSMSDQNGRELGILRRMVPQWLNLPEFRMLIIGFEEAHQNHGGAGALYVRLRRMPSSVALT